MPITPTELLEEEHRIIEKVMADIGSLQASLGGGEPIPMTAVQNLCEFFQQFVDRYHHEKEEHCLWPALLRKGLSPEGYPMADIIAGHKRSHQLFGDWVEASREYTATHGIVKQPLIKALQDLPATYLGLFWEEDQLLFPIAETILTPDDQQGLFERFASIDLERGKEWSTGFKRLIAKVGFSNDRGSHWGLDDFDPARID